MGLRYLLTAKAMSLVNDIAKVATDFHIIEDECWINKWKGFFYK